MSGKERARRVIAAGLIAFFLSFVGVAIVVSQAQFLWAAYHHGGL